MMDKTVFSDMKNMLLLYLASLENRQIGMKAEKVSGVGKMGVLRLLWL